MASSSERETELRIRSTGGYFRKFSFSIRFLYRSDFRPAQVIEQAPALRHHLEEAAARGMIFGVALQVFGQLRDPAGEERDLHIRAAGVLFVELELLHVHRVTAFCHKRSAYCR